MTSPAAWCGYFWTTARGQPTLQSTGCVAEERFSGRGGACMACQLPPAGRMKGRGLAATAYSSQLIIGWWKSQRFGRKGVSWGWKGGWMGGQRGQERSAGEVMRVPSSHTSLSHTEHSFLPAYGGNNAVLFKVNNPWKAEYCTVCYEGGLGILWGGSMGVLWGLGSWCFLCRFEVWFLTEPDGARSYPVIGPVIGPYWVGAKIWPTASPEDGRATLWLDVDRYWKR